MAAELAAKMARASVHAMTAAAPPSSPAAVAAFLRGLDRRARLFARVQAGHPAGAEQALAVVARVFGGEAGQSPIAQWPSQYWRLLLAAPSLRKPAAADAATPLPGIARLPADARAAVLLHLVAGLDDADAAAALGIELTAYQDRIRDALPRDALGQPDVDVWRAWRAAAERELARMPEPAAPAPTGVAAPPAASTAPAPVAIGQELRHRRRMRWLWLGVAACLLAMLATFFMHPRGRELFDAWRNHVKREALPPADAPKARFDAADPALHPDRDLLASPHEAALSRELPLLAWLAVASADPRAADAVALPLDTGVAASATASADAPDALAQRTRAWDALPARVRGQRRGAWQAWRALAPAERIALRTVARRLRQLPPEQQAQLRARLAAQLPDARQGWWLGPRLGATWPRVAALFAFVPESERQPALRLLRASDHEDIDALERLAQVTPPEDREAVRTALLGVPAAQRRAWVLERLQG